MAEAANAAPPKPRILPPIILLIAIGVMAALDHWAPGPRLIGPPWTHLGWILIVLAVVVAVVARNQFARAGTTIKPFRDSSALVTGGVFALSRNPMYVCLTTVLVGVFVVLGALSPFIVVPGFAWVIRTRFVVVEERMLEDAFGDAYRDYKARVRRWL